MSIDKEDRKQRSKSKEGVVFPLADSLESMPDNYQIFIIELKKLIKS